MCRLPTIGNKIVVIKMMKKSKLIQLKQVTPKPERPHAHLISLSLSTHK